MMAKDPAERPTLADVRKLFRELRGAGRPSAETPPPRRMATSVLVALAMFLAGVIAVGAVWLVQRNNKTEHVASPDEPAASAVAPPTPIVPTPPAATPPTATAPAEPTPPDIGAPIPGTAAAVDPTIEFEPDPIARNKAGSGSRKRRDAGVDEEVVFEVPSNRPGSLILVLESASTIEIDGTAVAQSSKGGRFEVKAGSHEIKVKAPGRQPLVRTFDVEAGGTAVIRVADDSGQPEPTP
jgi:hypothetical protein